jgi:hypothetical protein
MKNLVRISSLLFSLCVGAQASTIVAMFSNPVLQGNYIQTDGTPLPLDNSSTANYFIQNSLDPATIGTPPFFQQTASQLSWGAFDSSVTYPFSLLLFFGKQVPGDPSQTFDMGELVYLNGTSFQQTLIFGATMTLFATDTTLTNPTCDPVTMACGVSTINIVTTANLGLQGDPTFQAHDADFISISGAANQTFNVYEGSIATAELYGRFVGDPQIVVDSIVLNPGQELNGFIGNGQGQVAPEPASMVLFGAGLVALLVIRTCRIDIWNTDTRSGKRCHWKR